MPTLERTSIGTWYADNNPYRFTDPDGRQSNEGPVRSFGEFGDRLWSSIDAGIFHTAGQAIAADVAFGVGLATGDQHLQRVAIEGMRENVTASDGFEAAAMLVGPRGGRGTQGGLETRGYRPAPGERTVQGQVENATGNGNPTVGRGGQDLVRFRSTGHGSNTATATPQNVRNVAPDGRVFTGKGPDRSPTNRDMKELHRASTAQTGTHIRTRSGR